MYRCVHIQVCACVQVYNVQLCVQYKCVHVYRWWVHTVQVCACVQVCTVQVCLCRYVCVCVQMCNVPVCTLQVCTVQVCVYRCVHV